VIGTTGFNKTQEDQIKKYAKKIAILKAGNMSLRCKFINVFN
jgi:4-hydroxy-tetrahydrodipicolinate reductase